jgi:hypothetical protein
VKISHLLIDNLSDVESVLIAGDWYKGKNFDWCKEGTVLRIIAQGVDQTGDILVPVDLVQAIRLKVNKKT